MMETTMLNRKSVFVVGVLLLLCIIGGPSALAIDVCGESFVMIMAEADPVNIDCETGQLLIMSSTVNLLPGGHISDNLMPGGAYLFAESGSVVDIYGGEIDTALDIVSTATVTVHASSVETIPGILEEGQTLISNGSGTLSFDLVGTYEDGSPFSIPCNLQSNAELGLNVQQTAPDIDVLPASGSYDFGDVEIGTSATYMVHISNIGNAELEVTSVMLDIAGSTDFAITSAPEVPFVVAADESLLVDIEITYTPSAEGAVSTTVLIASDDEDEPLTEITLLGEGVLPPAPEIVVYPELLEHDFGDVEIGQTQTYVAQILNVGTADLTVTDLALDAAGSTDFSINAAPDVPFTVAPSESITVDIEITYTPTTAGYASTVLTIGNDDEDESVVEVAFGGVGIAVEIPPEQQIQAILDFIDASVADGTLIPYGPGNHPERRLCALKGMIRSAGTLIEAGYPDWAVCILHAVDKKTDGERRPPDFVVGEATETLNTMVKDLIDDLRTE